MSRSWWGGSRFDVEPAADDQSFSGEQMRLQTGLKAAASISTAIALLAPPVLAEASSPDAGVSMSGPAKDSASQPELLGEGSTRPLPRAACSARPARPKDANGQPVNGLVLASYTVQTDGTVHDIEIRNPNASPLLVQAVRDWLLACPYTPSMRGGHPHAVRILQPFQFKDEPAPGSQPTPDNCGAPTPLLDENGMSATGTVRAKFVVRADGHVSDVEILNAAPELLVRSVREWLARCRYTPALKEGQPVDMVLSVPFVFRPPPPASPAPTP